MDHYFKGLIAALALSACTAHAFYAQATPPAGWSSGGGPGGSLTGTKTAITDMFTNGSASSRATLNLGGRTASIPVTMRYASGASRAAAAAIMLYPPLRTAAAIAGWLGLAGLVYDATSGLWTTPESPGSYEVSSGLVFAFFGTDVWYDTAAQACAGGLPAGSPVPHGCSYPSGGYRSLYNKSSSCPAGWYVTPAGCVQAPPVKTVTQEDAIEELIKHPMPAEVPRHIPQPLPIDTPSVTPVFIPTGDPVKNPSFDPGQAPSPANPPAVQPGVEVKPAPTPGSPWQVETTPVNRPVTDPNAPPVREPQPLPDTGGGPSGNEPKDPDKTDFCEKYPTVIACQELKHEDDDTKLPEKVIDFDFNPIPGFQGTKSCPAFPNIDTSLGGLQISWQPFCDQLSKIANIILALAWFSAAWIFLSSRSN